MSLIERNFYTLKQSCRTIWNFTYKKNWGIIYKTFIDNKWSTYNVLVKECNKNFSALLLPDDRICVIYQDFLGNIILSIYNETNWSHHEILKKKNNTIKDVYLKILYSNNKIHIFYNIYLIQNNIRTLFHQTVDKNLNLSSPKMIDTTNVTLINPFSVHVSDNQNIFIMYQKLKNTYELGYKILDNNNTMWSDFYVVDKNISPYIDFSISSMDNTFHSLYIKNNTKTNILTHCSGYLSDLTHVKIYESINDIMLPCLFRKKDTLWDLWISDNSIHSCFSKDNGIDFSNIENELLQSPDIFKTIYISNSDNRQYEVNELYSNQLTLLPYTFVTSKNDLQNKTNYTDHFNETSVTLKKDMPDLDVEKKLSYYNHKLIQKDQIINQLNYLLKEEKNRSQLSSSKLKTLEKKYIEFKNAKLNIDKNISLLKDKLISKDKQVSNLEKAIVEKEEEISFLENKFSELEDNKTNDANTIVQLEEKLYEYENKILFLENELNEYENEISVLNVKIKDLENDLANAKSNSSLFKKFFSSN
ncbi:hypothetical protein [Clostridium ganghwense]|uniref:Uncharacterized protein n=1 Tax=Clostridium ganghwense TaxID=312089 RepID=A0ABT4CNM7_9CLOT|nr:hypothetical protein [Clostridium ganghwense]MCY6370548.1 hypothetical protein [Clostridium ganghwense]